MNKVVLFIANLEIGGAERVVSVLANNWSESNEVFIVTLFDHDVCYEISERVKIIPVVAWDRNSVNRLSKIYSICTALFRFRRIISSISPVFILSFMNKYNNFCLLSLFGTKNNIVVSERGSPFEKIGFVTRVLRKLLYRYSKGLICQTVTAQQEFSSEFFIGSNAVIPNPVSYLNPSKRLEQESLIVTVGRLVPGKGHSDLLKVAHKVRDLPWRFAFVGDGPLRSELEREAMSLQLTNVDFVGRSNLVGDWLSRSKIFVFASYSEGFPNALAEAMVCGKACVSYDCPTGPSDLIRDGENGFLVKCGDIETFSKQLRALATNDDLRLRIGTNAMALREDLSEEVISKRFFEYCMSRI